MSEADTRKQGRRRSAEQEVTCERRSHALLLERSPGKLREERRNKVRQKGMTPFPTISELWSQKEISQVGGREELTKVHKQMIVLTGQMHQKHRRDKWKHKVEKLQESCKAGSSLLSEGIKNESRPQMRVLQQMKRDDDTKEELKTLLADPEEVHELIAKAWQDIFRRWDKEAKPTWQHFERNYQHLWDTQPQMEMSELQVDQMKKMKT